MSMEYLLEIEAIAVARELKKHQCEADHSSVSRTSREGGSRHVQGSVDFNAPPLKSQKHHHSLHSDPSYNSLGSVG
jgi:hypothetical protein